MKHHIIVKFSDAVTDKTALLGDIKALFAAAEPIPGVRGYQFFPNCVARPNRYDLMIIVELEPDALPNWDESPLHKSWLSDFGDIVAQKAIFDCY